MAAKRTPRRSKTRAIAAAPGGAVAKAKTARSALVRRVTRAGAAAGTGEQLAYGAGGAVVGWVGAETARDMLPTIGPVDGRYYVGGPLFVGGMMARRRGHRRAGSMVAGVGFGLVAHGLLEMVAGMSGTGDAFLDGIEPSAQARARVEQAQDIAGQSAETVQAAQAAA